MVINSKLYSDNNACKKKSFKIIDLKKGQDQVMQN